MNLSILKKIRLKIQDKIAFIKVGEGAITKLDISSLSQLARIVKSLKDVDELEAVFIHLNLDDIYVAGEEIGKSSGKKQEQALIKAQNKGQELLNSIADLETTTVCVVEGRCISTGLELALACDHVVASKDSDTILGFQDIEQGLVPAMGGIFRLVGKVGLQKCLDIVLAGKDLSADDAVKVGVVDLLCDHFNDYRKILNSLKLLEESTGSVTATHRLTRFVSESSTARKLWFKKARQKILEETRGFLLAPLKLLDLMEYSQKRELPNYCSMETRVFHELLKTEQSKKLRIFNALYSSYKKRFAVRRWRQKTGHVVVVAESSKPFNYQDLTHASLVLDLVNDPMVVSSISPDCLWARRIDPAKQTAFHGKHVAFFSLFEEVGQLVEVVASEHNSSKDVHKVCRYFESVGTVPFILYRTDQSVLMRLLNVYFAEAKKLVVEGVASKRIEKASVDFGIKYGPFEFMEKIGIKCWLVEGRDVDECEIQNRLLMPMINEAAKVIEQKIGIQATHIDLMMVLVAGFPKFKGGLLRFADSHGLDKIVTQLKKLDYQISPYLNSLAEKGQGFYS